MGWSKASTRFGDGPRVWLYTSSVRGIPQLVPVGTMKSVKIPEKRQDSEYRIYRPAASSLNPNPKRKAPIVKYEEYFTK